MILNTNGLKPIYIQIAELIETEILNGHFSPDEKVYSQYQLAEMFTINPATAAKGLTLLLDAQILYKKRGLGMFVTPTAQGIIKTKRKNEVLKRLVNEIITESEQLEITKEELLEIITKEYQKRKESIDGHH